MNQLLKQAFIGIIGAYEPVTYTQTISEESVNVIPGGLAGVDWGFVLSGIAFLLVLYCTFRLIGMLFAYVLSHNKGGIY